MNGGRRTLAVLGGIGAGLLLAGVAVASEAAHGGDTDTGLLRKSFRISSGAP